MFLWSTTEAAVLYTTVESQLMEVYETYFSLQVVIADVSRIQTKARHVYTYQSPLYFTI